MIGSGEIDNSEADVMDKSKSREIVQTIMDHGVKNSQIYDLISMLAMELENTVHMKSIVNLIKNLQEPIKSPIITKE